MRGFSPFTQAPKLSNWEMYNYYKNQEHITGAEDEMKARKEAKRLAAMPVNVEPVTGTAPLPGIGRMKGVFDAFNKVAKNRAKMNKILEADLIKRGYKFVKKKKK